MALAYQQQIRHLYLLKTLVDSEAAIKNAGDFFVEVTPLGYVFKVMDTTGIVVHTKLVDPNKINYITKTYPTKKVGPKVEYSFEKDPTKLVGETITFTFKIHEGTNEDIYMQLIAGKEIVEGDTKATIMTDIAKQFAFALGNDARTADNSKPQITVGGEKFNDNVFFKITVTGEKFTIEEKNWVEEKYTLYLKYQDLMWRLTGRLFNEIMNSTVIKSTVVNEADLKQAVGQGYQMLAMEDYLGRGRSEYDTFSQGIDKHRDHAFQKGKEYSTLDLSFYDISRDHPHHSDQMLTFAEEGSAATALDALYAKIKDAKTTNYSEVNKPAGTGGEGTGGEGKMSAHALPNVDNKEDLGKKDGLGDDTDPAKGAEGGK